MGNHKTDEVKNIFIPPIYITSYFGQFIQQSKHFILFCYFEFYFFIRLVSYKVHLFDIRESTISWLLLKKDISNLCIRFKIPMHIQSLNDLVCQSVFNDS